MTFIGFTQRDVLHENSQKRKGGGLVSGKETKKEGVGGKKIIQPVK